VTEGTYADSVSGGYENKATGADQSWVGGGYENNASGKYASILGGKGNTLATEFGEDY
jgi:hypothetical protein